MRRSGGRLPLWAPSSIVNRWFCAGKLCDRKFFAPARNTILSIGEFLMIKNLDDFFGVHNHFRCYLLFLLAIILLLITRDFGANQKIFDYLAFGLTITSFFLSVFAIFYSMLGETR